MTPPADRPTLRLPDPFSDALRTWARIGYPREACGLLAGRREGCTTIVERVYRARNLSPGRQPDRFELDPGALVRAEDDARACGREVVGIWHSHPDRPAEPSERDGRGAWSGWSHLIVSVVRGASVDLRSWRLVGGRFVAEELRGERPGQENRGASTVARLTTPQASRRSQPAGGGPLEAS